MDSLSDELFETLTKPVTRGGIPYHIWIVVVFGSCSAFLFLNMSGYGFINTLLTIISVDLIVWAVMAELSRRDPHWPTVFYTYISTLAGNTHDKDFHGRTYEV